MAKSVTLYNVFIASPSDMVEERELLNSVIDELNRTTAKILSIKLELISWERNTFPSFGDYTQDVINKQIKDDYDIFIGLMGGHFGSATDSFESGTLEEFDRAYSKHKEDPKNISIMMYFKNVNIPLNLIDINQISKIQKFKKSLGEKGGLYWEYDHINDFKDLVRNRLNLLLPNLSQGSLLMSIKPKDNVKPPTDSQIEQLSSELDGNITTIEDDEIEEVGYLDVVVEVQDNFSVITDVANRVATYLHEVNSEMGKNTMKINRINNLSDHNRMIEIKRLIDKTADSMLLFVAQTKLELPLFREAITKGFSAFSDAYVFISSSSIHNEEEINILEEQREQLRESIVNGIESFSGLKTAIIEVPGMTTKLNKARREQVKIINRLISEYELSLSLLDDSSRERIALLN